MPKEIQEHVRGHLAHRQPSAHEDPGHCQGSNPHTMLTSVRIPRKHSEPGKEQIWAWSSGWCSGMHTPLKKQMLENKRRLKSRRSLSGAHHTYLIALGHPGQNEWTWLARHRTPGRLKALVSRALVYLMVSCCKYDFYIKAIIITHLLS